jgi:hypothetical protein
MSDDDNDYDDSDGNDDDDDNNKISPIIGHSVTRITIHIAHSIPHIVRKQQLCIKIKTMISFLNKTLSLKNKM